MKDPFLKKHKSYFLDPEEKTKLLKNLAETLKDNEEIAFAYIHGSFPAENSFHDIDIAIYLEPVPPGEAQFTRTEISMEVELEEKFGYPFDVRIINRAPLSFRYNVLKNGRLLFSKDEDLSTHFAARTIGDYIDFLPYRRRYLKEVLGLEV
ncbi:MAG: nucleotidyltransferase domain-containing protein [Peptococcaceae bacterium]|nr:nucleotidyltransferase domain-containing protein [Peptococcaceae bacterium]